MKNFAKLIPIVFLLLSCTNNMEEKYVSDEVSRNKALLEDVLQNIGMKNVHVVAIPKTRFGNLPISENRNSIDFTGNKNEIEHNLNIHGQLPPSVSDEASNYHNHTYTANYSDKVDVHLILDGISYIVKTDADKSTIEVAEKILKDNFQNKTRNDTIEFIH